MRKVLFFAAFGLIISTSCKKTYECECETKDDATGQVIDTSQGEITTTSKKKAKSACESTTTLNGLTIECKFKVIDD